MAGEWHVGPGVTAIWSIQAAVTKNVEMQLLESHSTGGDVYFRLCWIIWTAGGPARDSWANCLRRQNLAG